MNAKKCYRLPDRSSLCIQVKPMAQTEEVSRLLAGAAKTIAGIRYCWLVTEAGAGSRGFLRAERTCGASRIYHGAIG
jgi:hypothetical protein